jgi:hypothetical protein
MEREHSHLFVHRYYSHKKVMHDSQGYHLCVWLGLEQGWLSLYTLVDLYN